MGANPARAIYGTILSTALIAAYSEDPGSDPLQVAVAVIAAALVFWLAHVYAEAIADGAGAGPGRPGRRPSAPGMRSEWPLVLGALPPVVPLLLAPLGLLSDDAAEDLALIVGIAVLTICGKRDHLAPAPRAGPVAVSVLASAFFGLVIVGLKALVH